MIVLGAVGVVALTWWGAWTCSRLRTNAMWFGVLQTLEWAGLLDEEFTRLGPEEILVRAWRGRATMEANEAAGVCSGPCDHSRCRQIRDLRARLEELA